jgi:hypothetical protein
VILAAAVVTVGLFLRNRPERYEVPDGDYSLLPSHPPGSRIEVRRIEADEPLAIGTDVVFKVDVEGERYDRLGRVRGVGGDKVGAREGFLTVNGEFVGPFKLRGEPMGRIPQGRLLILATSDTNTAGLDSRAFGFIPRESVWGIILE